jgi:MraZ protein
VFWGSHVHVLDDKGRTSLPKDHREILERFEGDAWITAYPDCLAIFPAEAFASLRERLLGPTADMDSIQHLQRLIVGMAAPCSVDKAGRILIPPMLRSWARLERDIVVAGCDDRIEIWDRSRHQTELEQTRERYPEYSRGIRGVAR